MLFRSCELSYTNLMECCNSELCHELAIRNRDSCTGTVEAVRIPNKKAFVVARGWKRNSFGTSAFNDRCVKEQNGEASDQKKKVHARLDALQSEICLTGRVRLEQVQ